MNRSRISHWLSGAALALAVALVAITTFAGVAAAAPLSDSSGARANGWQPLPGHLVPALKQAHALRATDGVRLLHLAISLPLRNSAQLHQLIAAQGDRRSPLYQHFLTPAQFTADFGPTQASADAVTAYLRAVNISVTRIFPNRALIDATGSVAAVERAFAVQIDDYSYQGRTVYAPASEPSVPASLAGQIAGIIGLDDVARAQPLGLSAVHTPASAAALTGQPHLGPNGGYTPSELRTAYDMNSLISNADGTGQTIAIFELAGYNPNDVNTYLSQYSLGTPKYQNVLVDGATNTQEDGSGEVELDMEVASAIAPGANQLIYIGNGGLGFAQANLDLYQQIATDHAARVVSTSWGDCEAHLGSSYLQAIDNIFAQTASQGQAVFAASGDSGAYGCNDNNLEVGSPSDDPNVVGVGGTNLQTGSGGTYGSESVWANPNDTGRSPNGAGGGGGLSLMWALPSYQVGPGVSNQFSNGAREVPDVSADADPASGYSVYCSVSADRNCNASAPWTVTGGTSAAAPLWAAMTTDINEYLINKINKFVGEDSAVLYALFNTTQTYPAYHDITAGTNLYYPATAGYDLASGIGSPDAWNMAQDLCACVSGGTIAPTTTGVFRPSNGALYLKYTNATGYADVVLTYGLPGDLPVTGDWTGKGYDSIGIYRNGTFYLRNSNTTGYADIVVPFGASGDIPVAGNWTGTEHEDTIGVYRPSNSTFYLRESNTSGPPDLTVTLGISGDVPIVGDWTGQGKDTVGVFRPSNGIVYLRNSNTTGYADIAFVYGVAGDKPVVGDWTGQGKDTIGVDRNGQFLLRNSNTTGPADISFYLGVSGDDPISGVWKLPGTLPPHANPAQATHQPAAATTARRVRAAP